jgi:hypothetical protein
LARHVRGSTAWRLIAGIAPRPLFTPPDGGLPLFCPDPGACQSGGSTHPFSPAAVLGLRHRGRLRKGLAPPLCLHTRSSLPQPSARLPSLWLGEGSIVSPVHLAYFYAGVGRKAFWTGSPHHGPRPRHGRRGTGGGSASPTGRAALRLAPFRMCRPRLRECREMCYNTNVFPTVFVSDATPLHAQADLAIESLTARLSAAEHAASHRADQLQCGPGFEAGGIYPIPHPSG